MSKFNLNFCLSMKDYLMETLILLNLLTFNVSLLQFFTIVVLSLSVCRCRWWSWILLGETETIFLISAVDAKKTNIWQKIHWMDYYWPCLDILPSECFTFRAIPVASCLYSLFAETGSIFVDCVSSSLTSDKKIKMFYKYASLI